MPTTYEPIATTTLGSAQSSVSFTSISGSYTDLVLIVHTLGVSTTQQTAFRINSDTGSNYSRTYLTGTGSAANSGRNSGLDSGIIGSYGSAADVDIAHFMNYANTTTYKTVIARGGGASNEVKAQVNLWSSTAAITSITVLTSGGTFNSGSTFTLYGIKAA